MLPLYYGGATVILLVNFFKETVSLSEADRWNIIGGRERGCFVSGYPGATEMVSSAYLPAILNLHQSHFYLEVFVRNSYIFVKGHSRELIIEGS
jgi:hypothetical protein